MPGYMLHHNQTGHPVMGEIGPRRTAFFIWLWLACDWRVVGGHNPT